MDSILTTIKKLLGIDEEYDHFDQDLIVNINSVLMILRQMGVGPAEGFSITGPDETWDEYLTDIAKLEAVKTYIYLKVKMVFDPTSSSAVSAAYDRLISELEYRLYSETNF